MSFSDHPAEYPPPATLYRHQPMIASTLTACGVEHRDVQDLTQAVIVDAWIAIRDGRYRPVPASGALHSWLRQIAIHKAGHYCARRSRGELPCAHPEKLLRGTFDGAAQLDARDALRACSQLTSEEADVLLAFAAGPGLVEFARLQGLDERAAWSRLRLARIALEELLAGRGWRRVRDAAPRRRTSPRLTHAV